MEAAANDLAQAPTVDVVVPPVADSGMSGNYPTTSVSPTPYTIQPYQQPYQVQQQQLYPQPPPVQTYQQYPQTHSDVPVQQPPMYPNQQ